MSPSRLPTQFYEMPASDAELTNVLNLNGEDLQFIKHEVTDAADRTEADSYYDAVAISFLLDVAPLFPTSSNSHPSAAEVAQQVHSRLREHLHRNKSVPVHLPDGYPNEDVPHLRSFTRRLWLYLIKGIVLNVSRPTSDDTLAFIATFLKEFFAHARQQPYWSAWEKQTDDDLRLSWVLGDWLGESPPWYVESVEASAEYRSQVEAYNRSAKFSAYLVREGFPYHVSLWYHIVFALGKVGEDGDKYQDPKTTNNAILVLPEVIDIGGEVLRGLCFGGLGQDERMADLAELERKSKASAGSSLADYSKENWDHWESQAAAVAVSTDRNSAVKEAAKKVEDKMRSLSPA